MRIPDYCNYLVGWRAWSVKDGTLMALHRGGNVWPKREPCRATCRGRNDAPHAKADDVVRYMQTQQKTDWMTLMGGIGGFR